MEIIETLDHDAFTHYLKKFGNTICGRHPIGVFLGAVQALRQRGTNGFSMNLKFLNYDQSNECTSMRDSSVSYAAAVYTFG
jgi:AmmeMemoRadiSam system protein B